MRITLQQMLRNAGVCTQYLLGDGTAIPTPSLSLIRHWVRPCSACVWSRLGGSDCERLGQQQNNWVWDQADCSPTVTLSSNQRAAYFHTDPVNGSVGTAGVRGSQGFLDGEHYWEVQFLEPPRGTSVMVGVVTKDAPLHTGDCSFVNLIGKDEQGWGLSYKGQTWHGGESSSYCTPFYQEDTVVGVHLNLYTGTLSFYRNGQHLGVAYTGLDRVDGPLYPAISSTSANTELEVTRSCSRYLTLQEKCLVAVAKQLRQRDDVQQLPLPVCFKRHLLAIK